MGSKTSYAVYAKECNDIQYYPSERIGGMRIACHLEVAVSVAEIAVSHESKHTCTQKCQYTDRCPFDIFFADKGVIFFFSQLVACHVIRIESYDPCSSKGVVNGRIESDENSRDKQYEIYLLEFGNMMCRQSPDDQCNEIPIGIHRLQERCEAIDKSHDTVEDEIKKYQFYDDRKAA